eukprot:3519038-Alexandrium_andersonii.AAC.1
MPKSIALETSASGVTSAVALQFAPDPVQAPQLVDATLLQQFADYVDGRIGVFTAQGSRLSLIHISEPTRLALI